MEMGSKGPRTLASVPRYPPTHGLARNPRAMTGRPGHAVNALDPRSANQKQMGPPIQFVAGQRAYRDSVRRRVNYNVMYGWGLLRDAPLGPVARLHAVVLWTAVHAVWLHLSHRG